MIEWFDIEKKPPSKNADYIMLAHLYDDGDSEMTVAIWWVGGWFIQVSVPNSRQPHELLPIPFIPTHWGYCPDGPKEQS